MTADDRPVFAAELALVAEVFGEALSPTRIGAYFVALEEYDLPLVQAAMRQAIKGCRFFPKPSEVRELIDGSEDDRAALAWVRLVRAVELVGTYASVDFGDPVLHATIGALGGWTEQWRIERMDERDLSFRRAEFVRLYRALSRRPVDDAPKRLVGQQEAYNAARGYLGRDATLRLDDGGRAMPRPALPPAAVSPPAALVERHERSA